MNWLAIAIAATIAGAPPEPPEVSLPWTNVGRLVTIQGHDRQPDPFHLGARVAAFVDNEADGALEAGIGGTVQITVAWLP